MAARWALVFHVAFVRYALCYNAKPKRYIDDIGVIPDDTLWKARGIMGWNHSFGSASAKKEAPTRQPFTRSQALQSCAQSTMPQDIFFSGGSEYVAEYGAFGGRWMTRDGAELVQWIEDPLAWQKGTLRLNVAGIRLSSVVPVELEDEDIEERWKARKDQLKRSMKLKLRGKQVEDHDRLAIKKKLLSEIKVVFRDCDDQPLYTLWATTRFPKTLEIHNREGTLLARGEEVDPALLGQPLKQRYWVFRDPKGKQLAKAATPQLDQIRRQVPSQDNMAPWEMLFSPVDSSPNSIPRVLASPNERWVIAAALQWRACQDMQRPQYSSLFSALPPPLVMTCIVIFALGLCFMSRLLSQCIFDLVYPPKRDEDRNPYLFEWMTELYGELLHRRLKDRVFSQMWSPRVSYSTLD
jgi:hypothetical protein